MKRLLFGVYLGVIIIGTTVLAMGAVVSKTPSLSTIGAPLIFQNGTELAINTIENSLTAPTRPDSENAPAAASPSPYHDWIGSIMADVMCDPTFNSNLDVADMNFINVIHYLDDADRAAFLALNKLLTDTSGNNFLPASADACMQCHAPSNRVEIYSDHYMDGFSFLKD